MDKSISDWCANVLGLDVSKPELKEYHSVLSECYHEFHRGKSISIYGLNFIKQAGILQRIKKSENINLHTISLIKREYWSRNAYKAKGLRGIVKKSQAPITS